MGVLYARGGVPGLADPTPAARPKGAHERPKTDLAGHGPGPGRRAAPPARHPAGARLDRVARPGPGPGGDRHGAVPRRVPGPLRRRRRLVRADRRRGRRGHPGRDPHGRHRSSPGMSKPRIVAARLPPGRGGVPGAGARSSPALTMLVVSFILGLTFAYRKIPADTIVQESVPDRYRGRVFAAYDFLLRAGPSGGRRPVDPAHREPVHRGRAGAISAGRRGLPGVDAGAAGLGARGPAAWRSGSTRAGGPTSRRGRSWWPARRSRSRWRTPRWRRSAESAGGGYRLRAEDGNLIEVWAPEGSETWTVSRW